MSIDFAAARLTMIDSQVRTNDVPDLVLQAAMGSAPREKFCPEGRDYLAYAESVIEYAPGAFLMEPRDIAKLLHAVSPREGEQALTIAGPYAAMVLARIGLTVTAFQPAGAATEAAERVLSQEGVTVVGGDLAAPALNRTFDLVVVEGAVSAAPEAWLKLMAPGGRLGVIVRKGPLGKAMVYGRGADGIVGGREAFDATPPILPGFEPKPAFSF